MPADDDDDAGGWGDSHAKRVSMALELIEEGELSRALRILHSTGVLYVDERVLAQLQAKHPSRSEEVPAGMAGMFPRLPVHLAPTFRKASSSDALLPAHQVCAMSICASSPSSSRLSVPTLSWLSTMRT